MRVDIMALARPNLAIPSVQPSDGYWHCPNCGQRLGEVRNGRLVVSHNGRTIICPAIAVEQTCHRCLVTSVLIDRLP